MRQALYKRVILTHNRNSSRYHDNMTSPSIWPISTKKAVLRRAHTQRFQSADSGLDGCFQQKQSVIGSTSPDVVNLHRQICQYHTPKP